MTYAPQTLRDLAAYWISQGGVNLGIVGDAPHISGGVSYHLGADDLADGAYSARLPRDKAGLTNAASAIDLGKLGGTLANLQHFSRWLVGWCRIGGSGTRDIREVIYSPDGWNVRRYDATTGALYVGGDGTGQGDNSHRYHTHISYWRDSEGRDKRAPFRTYFDTPDTGTEPDDGDDMAIVATNPRPGLWDLKVVVDGCEAVILHSGKTIPLPRGTGKPGVCKVFIPAQGFIGIGGDAYVLGDENPATPDSLAVLFARDVQATPAYTAPPPAPNEVAAYNQGVQTVKAAANAVPEK